jgi:hypothetical protein
VTYSDHQHLVQLSPGEVRWTILPKKEEYKYIRADLMAGLKANLEAGV